MTSRPALATTAMLETPPAVAVRLATVPLSKYPDGARATRHGTMTMRDSTKSPPRTLTGLGPPEPSSGGEWQASGQHVPDAIRPWTVPDDHQGASGGDAGALHVPLSPVLPGWLWPRRARDFVRPMGEASSAKNEGRAVALRTALGALALVGAGALGFALGRGPVSPPAAAMTPEVGHAASGVGPSIACSPARPLPAWSERSAVAHGEPSPAPPKEARSAEVQGEPAEGPDRAPAVSRAKHHRERAAVGALPANPLAPDPARVQSVADAVSLEDDDVSEPKRTAPDAGTGASGSRALERLRRGPVGSDP